MRTRTSLVTGQNCKTLYLSLHGVTRHMLIRSMPRTRVSTYYVSFRYILSIHKPMHLCLYLLHHLSVCLSMHLSVPIHPSVFTHPCACSPSIHLSTCPRVHLCTHSLIRSGNLTCLFKFLDDTVVILGDWTRLLFVVRSLESRHSRVETHTSVTVSLPPQVTWYTGIDSSGRYFHNTPRSCTTITL